MLYVYFSFARVYKVMLIQVFSIAHDFKVVQKSCGLRKVANRMISTKSMSCNFAFSLFRMYRRLALHNFCMTARHIRFNLRLIIRATYRLICTRHARLPSRASKHHQIQPSAPAMHARNRCDDSLYPAMHTRKSFAFPRCTAFAVY